MCYVPLNKGKREQTKWPFASIVFLWKVVWGKDHLVLSHTNENENVNIYSLKIYVSFTSPNSKNLDEWALVSFIFVWQQKKKKIFLNQQL